MHLRTHTHFIHSQQLPNLIASLIESNLDWVDVDQTILLILNKYQSRDYYTIPPRLDYEKIKMFFNPTDRTFESIILMLQAHSHDAWCLETLKTLQELSPISLMLTFFHYSELIKHPNYTVALDIDFEISKVIFNKEGDILTNNILDGIDKLLKKSNQANWPKMDEKAIQEMYSSIKTNVQKSKLRSKL